jgi:hypothetical protein
MEYTQIINLITSLGLPTAIAILLWKRQTKMEDDNKRIAEEHKKDLELKDEKNRKDTEALMEIRDERITALEECSKEDKKIFQDTVNSFNNAVKSFESINTNVIGIQDKLITMEQDITIIKTKMDK